MESKTQFRDDQELQGIDLQNAEDFAELSIDNIVHDAIDDGSKFYGFPITNTSANQINVGAGRIYVSGQVYANSDTGGVLLNMFGDRPTSTFRIMNVVATPKTVDADVQPRDFLINAETLETEPSTVPMRSDRRADIDYVPGKESANPQPPVVSGSDVLIAQVLMSPTGVVSVTYVETNRIRSLALAHKRLDDNDVYLDKIGSRVDTLGTDITTLASRIDGLANLSLVKQIAYDVAVLKEKVGLPSSYSSYSSDYFLDSRQTDTTNAANLCLVREGIRFAAAQTQIQQIALQNALDPKVSVANNFMVPTYTPSTRISVVGNDKQVAIAQYSYQTITTQQKTVARTVTSYGSEFDVCTNSAFWNSGTYDPLTGIFTRKSDGATFNAAPDLLNNGGMLGYVAADGVNVLTHTFVRLQQFWTDTVNDTYWDCVSTTASVSGSIVAQTFLNTQGGYLCNMNLYFAQVAASGDVTVMITDTNSDGTPDYTSVIATTVLPVANLKLYPTATPCPFTLPYLDQGKRFAVVLITPGNHQVCQVGNNKYAQGSFFQSTDGAFSQGDLVYDLAFEAQFCQFTTNRCVVSMAPLTLAGGIASIKFNVTQVAPEGTKVLHQVFLNGAWTTVDQNLATLGLPALLQYQIVLLGTTDIMPGIGLNANSEVTTSRPRGDFSHYSTAQTLPNGVTTTQIQVKVRMEAWDPLHHTLSCRILTGTGYATANSYSLLADAPAADDPNNARERTYTFNLGSAVSSYKINISGTTDAVLNTFLVANRKALAL